MSRALFLPLAMLAFVVSAAATSSLSDGTPVSCYPPLSLVTSSIPSAKVGSTYSVSLTAKGGQPPYTWSAGQPSLPLAFSLSSGGELSGTPPAAGTFTFSVIVSDSLKQNVVGPVTFTVTANNSTPAPAPTPIPAPTPTPTPTPRPVPSGTTYYLSPTGSDSNTGLTSSLPWLTPNHAVNCGDVIIAAASTAYANSDFASGSWGSVTCADGNNVAWLKCATFDGCKITASNGKDGMWVDKSYWGVQGWEVHVTTGAYAACFVAAPNYNNPVEIHHIVFANDIANGCYGNGFASTNDGKTASVDYLAVVGNIAYNAAQGDGECYSGISVYQPIASDFLPGTHIYVAGNFSWGNVDPDTCSGGAPTDGEGIILDSINGGQSGLSLIYDRQIAVENNIVTWNGSQGVAVAGSGNTLAPIYIAHNTSFGNNTGHTSNTWCGDFSVDSSGYVQETANLNSTGSATGCASGAARQYVYQVSRSAATVTFYGNFGYSAAGNDTSINGSLGFAAFGPNNIFGTDPAFVATTEPSAPSCETYSSVPACMATVIADFTPKNAAALSYGYQKPSATETSDPLFPQWLCNVNLPSGLISLGCQTGQ